MTTAAALPAMPMTQSPTPATATGQAVDTGATPLFATLLGATSAEEGALDGVDELPPEAVALLLAAMVGVAPATTCAAGAPPARSAPSTASPASRLATSSGSTATAQVPDATATDAALALEAVLQDLLLTESPETADTKAAEAPTARADAAPLREALTWVPGAIDAPLSRSHASEAAPRHAAPIQTPVGTPGWSDELAGRIAWIARDNLQSASIRLSPEHLGPLDVQISVRDGDAVVSFGASHADTRAALEQALPRLREMLASQGIALAQANVSEHAPRHDQPPPQRLRALAGDEPAPQEVTVRLPNGLVDLYA
ncbi:MAG: flagellar hook-length control protein FliK [Steroidobacteraceae bacterium]